MNSNHADSDLRRTIPPGRALGSKFKLGPGAKAVQTALQTAVQTTVQATVQATVQTIVQATVQTIDRPVEEQWEQIQYRRVY